MSRETRRRMADRLGLATTDVPWHTARDNLAEVVFAVAAVAATCGKIARELIELSRPEISELQEPEASGRGASSTMPQKRNPISSEAIVAMSVLAIHQVPALLTAMQGGHERSAGEWQIEWEALPAAVSLSGGCLLRTCEVVEGLQVFPERMLANAKSDGELLMAEKVMITLAPIIGRDRAHETVYSSCVAARAGGTTVREALERADLAIPLTPDFLEPDTYLGETTEIVAAAIEAWKQTSPVEPSRAN